MKEAQIIALSDRLTKLQERTGGACELTRYCSATDKYCRLAETQLIKLGSFRVTNCLYIIHTIRSNCKTCRDYYDMAQT